MDMETYTHYVDTSVLQGYTWGLGFQLRRAFVACLRDFKTKVRAIGMVLAPDKTYGPVIALCALLRTSLLTLANYFSDKSQ